MGFPINHEKLSLKLGSQVSEDKLRDSLFLTSNLFKLNIYFYFISASKYSKLKHVLFSPRSESLPVLIAYFTFVITDCLNEISLLTKDTIIIKMSLICSIQRGQLSKLDAIFFYQNDMWTRFPFFLLLLLLLLY